MSTEINWPKLVTQGRVKAIGIPWSKEEQEAIAAGIPAAEVRAGIFDQKSLDKAQKEEEETQSKPVERMTKPELVAHAKTLNIVFDEGAVTRAELIGEIEKAEPKGTDEGKQEKE